MNVVIITGGGRGIGAATARLAAQRGYHAAINYLQNRERAEAVVREIESVGGAATALQADIRVESDVRRLFGTAALRGPITALVNNAATIEPQARLEETDADRIARIFATNVTGAMLCAREAVPWMSTRRGGAGGAIVNVSSGAARTGSPNEYVDYAASKGALDTFTIGLAKEVAGEGIRVNGVRPGFTYTEMHAQAGEPERVDRLKSRVPMQRGGQPGEIARAILWLLSGEASYVTGSILDVAGGL